MSIFSAIWHFFTGLFSAAQTAWDKLPSTTQQAMLNGSGIMNIINQYTNQDPALVVATIQANYPNEDPALIYSGLAAVLKAWNVTVPPDLIGVVTEVQKYLKATESGVWPAIIHGATQLLALVLSGGSTPFEIIASLLQFVYSTFVKGSDIKLASVPETTSQIQADPSPAVGFIGSVVPQ